MNSRLGRPLRVAHPLVLAVMLAVVLSAVPALLPGQALAAERPGFFEYVRRGLRGEVHEQVAPVPPSLSQPARRLLEAEPDGAAPLPASAVAVDVDLAGAYLDTKNDATVGNGAEREDLVGAWTRARAAGPGRPALEPGQDPAAYFRARIDAALARPDENAPEGAEALRAAVADLVASDDPPVRLLAYYDAVVTSLSGVQAGRAYDAGLRQVEEIAREVAAEDVPRSGPLADTVLAAADAPQAPARAVDARRFGETRLPPDFAERIASANGVAGTGGRPALEYSTPAGPRRAGEGGWVTTVRGEPGQAPPERQLYYLALPSRDVALVDGSLLGWGFTLRRAYLVEATRVGRILAVYQAP